MGATTMAVLAGSSAVMSLSGAYGQAQARKGEAAYQRTLYNINKNFADAQAEDAVRRGNKEASQIRKGTKQLIGAQRAALAAQGVEIDSGTARELQEDARRMGKLDILTVKNNAWREAWGYRVQAMDATARGTFASLTLKNEARSTLLTGGLSAVRYGVETYRYGRGA